MNLPIHLYIFSPSYPTLIIKAHGGYIDVDSEKGKGTTFSIYLPGTEEKIREEKELSDEVVKGGGVILLVDDEEIVLDAGEQMLKINIWLPAFVIGVVAMLFTVIGLHLNKIVEVPTRLSQYAETIGGIVLLES